MSLDDSFVQGVIGIWRSARQKAVTLVNREMVNAYWEIGRRIALEEQRGEKRAQYGQYLLRELASALSGELDKGLDERELRKMRQFYSLFPIRDALRPELTWSHYRLLLRVEHTGAREYYLQEAADAGWGTRQLERSIQNLHYERVIANQPKRPSLCPPPPAPVPAPEFLIKDPYLFDFLGLTTQAALSESDLEQALIGKLHHFLLELGRGFAFVARQLAVATETRRYYLDLVFYNYLLKCFFIVDLKIGELTHQDVGQMNMYRQMFDELKRMPGDQPTIGIILCTEKDETLVRYSGLEENKHLFASTYKLLLPTEDELSRELATLQR